MVLHCWRRGDTWLSLGKMPLFKLPHILKEQVHYILQLKSMFFQWDKVISNFPCRSETQRRILCSGRMLQLHQSQWAKVNGIYIQIDLLSPIYSVGLLYFQLDLNQCNLNCLDFNFLSRCLLALKLIFRMHPFYQDGVEKIICLSKVLILKWWLYLAFYLTMCYNHHYYKSH